MFKKIILPFVALAISGCAVTTMADFKSVETRKTEPTLSSVTVPLSASISVLRNADGTPIKAEKTVVFHGDEDFPSRIISEGEVEQFRNIALNRVAQQYNADLLVGALTDVTYVYNDSNSKHVEETLTVRVSGYPAVYTDFKSITSDDKWILDYYIDRNRPAPAQVIVPAPKR